MMISRANPPPVRGGRNASAGLDEAEREYLRALIVSSMYQSFCYGYGIGKIEGKNENRVVI